jgi:peptide/nickel transport system substrate-binding protein
MADSLLFDKSQVADSYIPAAHPLFNPQVKRYPYDPKAGAALLDSAGWVDQDGNPATARQARGVNGVADGTPFEITLLTTDETEKQAAAQMIQESLAQCGIKINISTTPWDKLFASGPGSALFGRNFTLAQFGWASTIEPPCLLYTTQEIPGPYPDFPKGWGGANVSGYSNPQYDWACQQALFNLPGTPEHTAAHLQAQMIFTDDLPALPLYWRLRLVAMRPDLCGVKMDASSDNALWKLEEFDYGENCPQ